MAARKALSIGPFACTMKVPGSPWARRLVGIARAVLLAVSMRAFSSRIAVGLRCNSGKEAEVLLRRSAKRFVMCRTWFVSGPTGGGVLRLPCAVLERRGGALEA